MKTLIFCISLTCVSVILQSCCTNTFKIIGSESMSILDLSNYNEIDTIKNSFILSIFFEAEMTGITPSLSLMNSVYATSCEENYVNKIETTSLKITLDKDFTHDGTTILAGENFSNLSGITFEDEGNFGNYFEINFSQELLDNCIFQEEMYTFKVELSTTDGLELSNEASAVFDL